jgi:hypothetical protein
MKIPSEQILKPGVVLEAKKIDWSDPEVKAILAEHHHAIDELRKIKVIRYERNKPPRTIIFPLRRKP